MLLVGGSEGGYGPVYEGALLASHGFPALSLAYFDAPDLPATLHDIPLEYFARAARLLAAQQHPGLVRGAVVYSPSATVNPGFPDQRDNAWTDHGRPVPTGTTIPLDHVSGPVLAIAGAKDGIWPSADSARLIMTELSRSRFPHQALIFPGAGHGVGTFPYLAEGTRTRHPVTGTVSDSGGGREGDALAQEQGWPKVLAFLGGLGRSS
ncbi:acyl-CoA thioester hydrolase/BAAT C-terminal domain-containing protein [Actinomadura opuntiae]|uniref:acyl-CoA thioester hydrolase/BAAT C-terminal domain-containing protein n=1 Tax=Actinomadura sp. OS1-43 TaxID=604315 RepID=UPI00255A9762|nr:acyl-CoA thioester hydrolase/BAAT C-terminal domain-containing protein [Actinomadura sp. OS1-43]MDL4816813.1 acyl-CoA thioester hydrolase/BAAT C-terminal domain-containing protein [Actinomadura sp. OS1-43]